MNVNLIWVLLLAVGGFGEVKPGSGEMLKAKMPMAEIYDIKMRSIEGEEISFEKFRGKWLLLVNVASRCGYTPQYEDLQRLHETYGNKVTVLGFPANNFGGQEPGTHEEILGFCKKNYGVTFQLFEKISVTGSDQHPLYQWLSNADKNGWNDQEPTWNFCKYLVNANGQLVKFYNSGVNPLSEDILKELSQE
ncbi:glutathione peroxidase [Agaribacillus aureus]